jgi:TRAP-type C4-dicarboxylate transport system permease small subunit
MKILRSISHWLGKLENGMAILIIAIMVLLSVAQIILRNFFGTSLIWGDAFLRHMVLWITFVGGSLATRERKHIAIDAIPRLVSPILNRYFSLLTNIFAIVVTSFLFRAGFTFVKSEREFGGTIMEGIPIWWMEIIIPIGFGVMVFRFLLNWIEDLHSTIKGEPVG